METIEMEVDDVKQSQKGKDVCVLVCANKETMIDGYEADVKVTISCNNIALFDEMNIPNIGNLIDIEFKKPAQTTLPTDEDAEEIDIELVE